MPDISLNLNGIKPLLSSLGLGDAASKDQPAPPPATPAPLPPQPTPPQAGFSAWSADPATQQRIANSLTAPGQSITPSNVPPASPLYGGPATDPTPAPLITPNPNAQPIPGVRPLSESINPFSKYKPLAMGTAAATPPPPATPQPGAGGFFPYTPPTTPAPLPTSAPTAQEAQQTLQRLDMAAHQDQYQKPGLVGQGWKGFLKYGVPAALVSAGSGLSNMGRGDPTVGFKMLNEQIAQDRGVPAANAATYDLRNVKPLKDAAVAQQAAAQLADTQQQTEQRKQMGPLEIAKAQKALADANKPEKQSPEDQAYAALLARKVDPMTAYMQIKAAGNVKDPSLQQQYLDALLGGDQKKIDAIEKTVKATNTDPKVTVLNAGADNRADAAAAKTAAAAAKAPKLNADEQKRADLAKNLNENIEALDDIATRRPELFGPVAGRWTEMRNTIGTSDADITKLEAIKHQLGMVAQGAHGMRSAQGVESAASSLLNGFHNSADATRAALGAARDSVKTFTDDANNPGESRGPSLPQASGYKLTATGQSGHKIGSNDGGKTWIDVKTGKKI